jgi:hypothetical protein
VCLRAAVEQGEESSLGRRGIARGTCDFEEDLARPGGEAENLCGPEKGAPETGLTDGTDSHTQCTGGAG